MVPTVSGSSGYGTDKMQYGSKVLGKDDFFKILIAQLKYQDPLEPTKDNEFIAQMAQFTAMEQMQNLNNEFVKVQAINMIGKKIEYKDDQGNVKNGTVSGVQVENGKSWVKIGDLAIDLSSITTIAQQ